jgi:hypothetical protein
MKHIAVVSLCFAAAFAHAQSGANPFSEPAPGQLNALRQWSNLPDPLRTDIKTKLAPLTEQQRQGLLTSTPGLSTLQPEEINTILAVVAPDVPAPVTEKLDQSYLAQPSSEPSQGFYPVIVTDTIDSRGWQWQAQTYKAGINGTLTKVAVQVRGSGSFSVEIRDAEPALGENLTETVFATSTFTLAAESMNADSQLVEVAVPAVPQTVGVHYAIVIKPASPGASLEWWGKQYGCNTCGFGYLGGRMFNKWLQPSGTPTPWFVGNGNYDGNFQTFVKPAQ